MSTNKAFEKSHSAPAPNGEPGGSILGHIWASIGVTIVLGIVCCGIYPLIVWGIGQVFFPIQANGSLVAKDGAPTSDDTQAVGSSLIGQNFSASYYFHPRPSAAGSGYDASSSGGTNLGPLSDKLINGVPAPAPATAPATAASQPDTAPATQVAASAPTTTPATTSAPASAPAAATPPTPAYDGIRLRVIHYAMDNHIDFKLYHVTYDDQGAIIPSSRKELTADEKIKYIDAQGNINDEALVEAFPHMDMSSPPPPAPPKDAVIADDFATLIPADAVTASGSGLDPHISPENAALQAQRVADARKLSKEKVMELIKQNTDNPSLGILGDPGVNVLRLNIALDNIAPMPAPAPTSAPASAPATAATHP